MTRRPESVVTDSPGVVVIGSLNVDLHLHVASLPVPGMTSTTGVPLTRSFGGKGANQAMAARHVGAQVRMIGAVGEDENGVAYRRHLADHGIDVAHVHASASSPTGLAVVMVDASGENMIVVASGANTTLGADHVRQGLIGRGEHAVIITQAETPAEAVLDGIRHGPTLIYNPAPARLDDAMTALCDRAQIVVPNESELLAIAGANSGDVSQAAVVAMARHIRRPGQAIVVTRGAQGALVVDDAGEYLAVAPVVRAVDTSGAGDAFCGVLAHELAQNCSLREAVDRAVTVATSAVQQHGAQLV